MAKFASARGLLLPDPCRANCPGREGTVGQSVCRWKMEKCPAVGFVGTIISEEIEGSLVRRGIYLDWA